MLKSKNIKWGSCYSIFSFMCMICRSLFVLLGVFFRPLCYLFFFDLRILFTPLVSSKNIKYHTVGTLPNSNKKNIRLFAVNIKWLVLFSRLQLSVISIKLCNQGGNYLTIIKQISVSVDVMFTEMTCNL